MERHPDLPLIENLIKGRIYLLQCRNLSFGVWDGDKGFIGIRTKFGSRFLFTELHWDADQNFGTVAHAVDIGLDIPENIDVVERLATLDLVTQKPVFYNQEKRGWCWEKDGDIDASIRPCSSENKDLFLYLDEVREKIKDMFEE